MPRPSTKTSSRSTRGQPARSTTHRKKASSSSHRSRHAHSSSWSPGAEREIDWKAPVRAVALVAGALFATSRPPPRSSPARPPRRRREEGLAGAKASSRHARRDCEQGGDGAAIDARFLVDVRYLDGGRGRGRGVGAAAAAAAAVAEQEAAAAVRDRREAERAEREREKREKKERKEAAQELKQRQKAEGARGGRPVISAPRLIPADPEDDALRGHVGNRDLGALRLQHWFEHGVPEGARDRDRRDDGGVRRRGSVQPPQQQRQRQQPRHSGREMEEREPRYRRAGFKPSASSYPSPPSSPTSYASSTAATVGTRGTWKPRAGDARRFCRGPSSAASADELPPSYEEAVGEAAGGRARA